MIIKKEVLEELSQKYPVGTRIRLLKMKDDPMPIPVGTLGTVNGIDGIGSLCVDWDNGSSLHVLYGIDEVEIINS